MKLSSVRGFSTSFCSFLVVPCLKKPLAPTAPTTTYWTYHNHPQPTSTNPHALLLVMFLQLQGVPLQHHLGAAPQDRIPHGRGRQSHDSAAHGWVLLHMHPCSLCDICLALFAHLTRASWAFFKVHHTTQAQLACVQRHTGRGVLQQCLSKNGCHMFAAAKGYMWISLCTRNAFRQRHFGHDHVSVLEHPRHIKVDL